MSLINRNSISDSKRFIKNLNIEKNTEISIFTFLSDSIKYANEINPNNWNINFDKNGIFVRFNVGQEYCIELYKEYLSVLVLKSSLKRELNGEGLLAMFKGYEGDKKVTSQNIDAVPDALVKVPNSVACQIEYKNIGSSLPFLEKPNHDFITIAIKNTKLLSNMYKAHSPGFIRFLSGEVHEEIKNPEYCNTIMTEEQYNALELEEEKIAKKMTEMELLNKIQDNKKYSIRKEMVITNRYKRSPYIAEYVKRKANGICYDCGQYAPFIIQMTKEPYLEVHHVISLSNGGDDTLENVVALCPNCHRKRHFG